MPKPKTKICPTCEVIIATSGDIHTYCDEPTSFVMFASNGGKVSACGPHAAMFRDHGLTIREAITEIGSGRAEWE